MALPHTKNSTAGRNMYEPIVGSQFEVYLIPPNGVKGAPILTEHAMSCEGLFDEQPEGKIVQKFKTATRTYDTNDGDTSRTFSITFSLNLNNSHQNYVYKTLKEWHKKKRNNLTGERGLKRNYTGTIVVVKHDRYGSIFWVRTAQQAWPSGKLPDLGNSYAENEPQALTVEFTSDYISESEA
jgi:hypothetical protein